MALCPKTCVLLKIIAQSSKKKFRGGLGGKNTKLAVRMVPGHYLSDYFGTTFAKIRLSCNSLKILN